MKLNSRFFTPVATAAAMLAVGLLVSTETSNAADTKVCPIYPYAFHDDYWSYYSVYCPSGQSAGGLDTDPNLSANCSSSSPPCIDLTKIAKGVNIKLTALLKSGPVDPMSKIAKNGLTKKVEPERDPTKYKKPTGIKKIATPLVTYFANIKPATGAGPAFSAKLILYKVEPKKAGLPYQSRLLGIGFQINKNLTAPDVSLDGANGEVVQHSTIKHRYLVTVGTVSFVVYKKK